jgi:hypothetical protein
MRTITTRYSIGLAVTAAIEPVAVGLATGCRDGAGATQLGQGCLRTDTLRIIADKEQHLGGCAGSHPVRLEQFWRELSCQGLEVRVVVFDFGVEYQPAPGDGA